MQRFLASLFLLSALGVAHAQTVKITTPAGACTYQTGTVTSDPATPGQLLATSPSAPVGNGCPSGLQNANLPVAFGPALPLAASATSLPGGTSVPDTFTVLPLNAVSCTGAIATTAGTGTGSLTGGSTICNTPTACTSQTLSIPATFTNASTTTSSTYNVSVTCSAATPASPQTTTSNVVTVTQAAASTGGTPVANFTFTTNGLAATFTDTSTDVGGTIGTHAWTFGDSATSTLANPLHTYTAAGTYNVAETVTDSANGTQNTKTQSVTVAATGCPIIASTTTGIANFSRLSGNVTATYFGGSHAGSVDATDFDAIYAPWPGNAALTAVINVPTNMYLSEHFKVPPNFFASRAGTTVYGEYTINGSGFSAAMSMSISTTCGDFSNPATNANSTVVSGCWINKHNSLSSGPLQWRNNTTCVLSDNTDYYLNIINADVSTVTANGGGTAASTKNSKCSSVCSDPVSDGPTSGL